jgi:microcystin-dependent protein
MDPFLGEIRMFAGNYAPQGWALCNGQLMAISQNTALFSLLGTMYGGDGRVTFALPNLRGRIPMNFGQGPGLTDRSQGEMGGEETVTLLSGQMPMHTHLPNAESGAGNNTSPANNFWAGSSRRDLTYTPTPTSTMSPDAIRAAGNNQPHDNMQPYLAVSFIIALQGIFPPRS